MLGGKLIGNGAVTISGLCPLEDPQPNHLSFSTSTSELALIRTLQDKLPAALIVSTALCKTEQLHAKLPLLQVSDPFQSIIKLMAVFYPKNDELPEISQKAHIDSSAKIGKNVTISAFCVIGPEAVIEDNAVLHPHVVLYRGARVGQGCIIHSGATVREYCEVGAGCIVQNGAVVGAEGFGYTPNAKGELNAVPQIGTAKLADQVDVGANACIDRATLGSTRIGQGTKIDNLVQIGHNVQVGKHSAICGATGISGSCKIGNHVVLGGHTGVADHLTIADGVRVGSGGKIERDILEKGDYAGHPLMKVSVWRRYVINAEKILDLMKLLKKSKSAEPEA